MIGESLAIMIVLLVLAVICRRSGKKLLARLTIPLFCVPASSLLGAGLFGVPSEEAKNLTSNSGAVIVGLVLAVLLSLFVARKVASKVARLGYLVVSIVFSAALTLAYVL